MAASRASRVFTNAGVASVGVARVVGGVTRAGVARVGVARVGVARTGLTRVGVARDGVTRVVVVGGIAKVVGVNVGVASSFGTDASQRKGWCSLAGMPFASVAATSESRTLMPNGRTFQMRTSSPKTLRRKKKTDYRRPSAWLKGVHLIISPCFFPAAAGLTNKRARSLAAAAGSSVRDATTTTTTSDRR